MITGPGNREGASIGKHAHKCRSCVHFDLPAVLSSSGQVLAHRVGRCQWKPAKNIREVMPVSVIADYMFGALASAYHNEPQRSMEPNDGHNCSQWEQR